MLTVISGFDSFTVIPRSEVTEEEMEGPKPVKSGKVKVDDVDLYYELYGQGIP